VLIIRPRDIRWVCFEVSVDCKQLFITCIRLQVNHAQVQLPYLDPDRMYSINPTGQLVQFETNFGLVVQFDGQWQLSVSIPKTVYRGAVSGLCGNNDGNSDNDWTTSLGVHVSGQPLADNLLGDSFIVPDPEETNPL
jgi:von Willebrand factor type D domain